MSTDAISSGTNRSDTSNAATGSIMRAGVGHPVGMGRTGRTFNVSRIGLEILGWLLLAAGVAALVLPGPGLLLLALGLWVLAKNYQWADKLLDPVKRAAYRGASEGVKTWPRIIAR